VNRDDLLLLLDEYEARLDDGSNLGEVSSRESESGTVARIRQLILDHANCFDRDCLPGHITASAWIVSREHRSVLLTHHRKLDRWLQLGGHTDGEADVLAAAIREAEEESGLRDFRPLPLDAGPRILDVDVHVIPAHGREPAHEHHDIRFMLEVSEAQTIQHQEAESHSVQWFPAGGIESRFEEESLARMASKAAIWLARDLGA